ncbi:hypothetical protein KP509_07G074200 [Ceratopteris richardii]|uniref:Uncharacterized protein n=1 Tax=Ceratopteris richardii TaxID=49495 RepID=A0A8T2UMM3_CERRI|nr:hypothetical protein KP509_07G074200 [Ceratopteris richardii]
MGSAPCLRGSEGRNNEFSSHLRSGSLTCESSPGILSSSSLLTDYAAPVHPLDEDEDESELRSIPSSNSSSPLLCSTQLPERHVFLCFKEPRSWPSVVEGADSDRLPRFLAAAVKDRKNEMMKKTRLIVCEGRDGTDSSNGDVMIFPDMVRYRGLTHFDVDSFVDEVLIQNRDWTPGKPERLLGTYVFVCAHGNHEFHLGVLGSAIIERFRQEIATRRLGAKLFVKPCSYIGGRKFVKNLIVYSSNSTGQVSGHCYGCVTPDNVSSVLDDFSLQGYFDGVEDRLSGCEDQEPLYSVSRACSSGSCSTLEADFQASQMNGHFNVKIDSVIGFQGQKVIAKPADSEQPKRRAYSSSMWWQASWWLCFWEKDDTLAALAVAGAAASVVLAYHLYKSNGGL